MAVLVLVLVLVAELVGVLVLVAVLVFVDEAEAEALADADGVSVVVAVADAESVADAELVLVAVAVEVGVEVDVAVDVPVADAVAVLVAVAVDVAVAEDVASPTVCVSSAIGMTIQLVPSEIARNMPPINMLAAANPRLSAVRLLKMTRPPSAPATTIDWSATLTNRFQLPLFTSEAAGRVNVTGTTAARVVKTEPKSEVVTV